MVKSLTKASRLNIVPAQVTIGHTVVAWLDYLDGKVSQAREQLTNMRALSQERGYRIAQLMTDGALSRVRLFDGDIARAVEHALAVIRLEDRNASADFTALSYETLGLAAQTTGDVASAKQFFEEGIEYARLNRVVLMDAALHASLCGWHLSRGDSLNAARAASVATQIASQTRNTMLQCTAFTLAAASAGLGGDDSEARHLFERARIAGKIDTARGRANPWCEGLYFLHYGEHLALTQQWALATSAFERTVKLYDRLECPERAGLARYGLARASLAVGDVVRAADEGRAGFETLQHVGNINSTDVGAWLYRNNLTGRAQHAE